MKFAAYKYEFKNPVILIDRALPSIYTNKVGIPINLKPPTN